MIYPLVFIWVGIVNSLSRYCRVIIQSVGHPGLKWAVLVSVG